MNVSQLEKIAAEANCSLCAVRAALAPLPTQGAWAKYSRLVRSERVRKAAGRHAQGCSKRKES